MSVWNVRNLMSPPINSVKCITENIDIFRLRQSFEDAKEFYSSCHILYTEAALLSTTIYRMKLKFRMHKDFKYMEKVSKCLEIFFKMNLSNHINYFLQLIPGPAKKITYLPTRDMLDYILVRLQGLSKLLVRIVETSKIAADLLQQKLHTGNFWMITLLSFSMVSRVYVIARYMAKFTCNIYDKIIPFRNKLHNTSSNNFLPQDYILPKDLRHWLNVDWIDEEVKIIEIDDELLSIKFFDLVDEDEDDVEFCKEYIDIKDDDDDDGDKDDEVQLTAADIVKKVKKKIDVTVLRGFVDDDVGEVIDLAEESMQTDKSNTEAQNKDTPVEIILDDTDAGEELLAISDTSEIEVIQNTIEESKSTTTNKRKIGIELKNQQSRSKKKKKNSSDGENVSPAKQKQVKKVTKMEVDLSQETKIKKKKRKSNNLLRKAEQESPNKKQKQKESNVKCKCKIKNQLRTKKRKVIKCKLCAK